MCRPCSKGRDPPSCATFPTRLPNTDRSPKCRRTLSAILLVQADFAFENFILEKLKSYAEQPRSNLHKTFQEVIQIQMEFMQTQLQSHGEQAKQFSEIYTNAGSRALSLICPSICLVDWPRFGFTHALDGVFSQCL